MLVADPQECGYTIRTSSMCPRTSNPKDVIHLLRYYSIVIFTYSPAVGVPAGISQSGATVFYCFRALCLPQHFFRIERATTCLPLSVAPINVLAGATDVLYAACMHCCGTATNCSTCSMMWRARTCCCCCCCICFLSTWVISYVRVGMYTNVHVLR